MECLYANLAVRPNRVPLESGICQNPENDPIGILFYPPIGVYPNGSLERSFIKEIGHLICCKPV